MAYIEELNPLNWPVVDATADEIGQLHLLHLSVARRREGRGAGGLEGFVVWASKSQHGGQWLGVRWDWVELHHGVLAISDPLSISSNLRLVDAARQALPDRLTVLQLNLLVYRLDWQNRVLRQIEEVGLRALAPC